MFEPPSNPDLMVAFHHTLILPSSQKILLLTDTTELNLPYLVLMIWSGFQRGNLDSTVTSPKGFTGHLDVSYFHFSLFTQIHFKLFSYFGSEFFLNWFLLHRLIHTVPAEYTCELTGIICGCIVEKKGLTTCMFYILGSLKARSKIPTTYSTSSRNWLTKLWFIHWKNRIYMAMKKYLVPSLVPCMYVVFLWRLVLCLLSWGGKRWPPTGHGPEFRPAPLAHRGLWWG